MPGRSATWAEIESFLDADEWTPNRKTGHDFYEKLLPNGDLLRTHVSRAGNKSMSPGRFRAILRNQLKVGEREFWDAVRSGRPVVRPADVDAGPPEHPAWVVRVLTADLHLTASDIDRLSIDDARRLVNEFRSRRKG